MDPKGRTKITKEDSEKPKEAEIEKQQKEMEVDEAAPHEASAEIQRPKRKVIRVESQETQDCVRETLAISQEEASAKCPTGVAIDAVKRPSDTGRLLQW